MLGINRLPSQSTHAPWYAPSWAHFFFSSQSTRATDIPGYDMFLQLIANIMSTIRIPSARSEDFFLIDIVS